MYDYILNLFVGHDDHHRERLHHPHLHDGNVYATNAYVAVKIPAEKLAFQYESIEYFPNVEKVLQEAKEQATGTLMVCTKELAQTLAKCRVILEKQKCECCEGAGSIECEHCGSDVDCKACAATGKKEELVPFARMEVTTGTDNTDNFIKMDNGHFFSPNLLNFILLTALVLNKPSFTLQYSEYDKASIVVMDDVEIIVMPKKHEK
jgi:hypothetical protein